MNASEYAATISLTARLRQELSNFESTPYRLLCWAVLDWLIISLTWLLMVKLDNIVVSIAGALIVASRLHGLGALLHDACHSRQRSRTWPLVEILAGIPIASSIAAMRYHHLRHHRYSGTARDPYRNSWIDRGPLLRTLLVLRGALLPAWWTLRAIVAPAAFFSARLRVYYARAFLQDRSEQVIADSNEIRNCMTADLRQLLVQSLLLTAALRSGFALLELYILPWIAAGVLNARRVLYEHAFAENSNARRATVYATTFDHRPNALIAGLLYPRNLGLHRAHHLFPTASFEHLPRLDAAVDESLNSAALHR